MNEILPETELIKGFFPMLSVEPRVGTLLAAGYLFTMHFHVFFKELLLLLLKLHYVALRGEMFPMDMYFINSVTSKVRTSKRRVLVIRAAK